MNILYEILENNGEITLKELIKNTEISERTLRNEIDRINLFLQENKFQSIEKIYGGKLVLQNIEEIKKQFSRQRSHIELSPKEKEDYIILYAIFNKTINLEELSEELDVSRTTIVNYCRDVKEYIAQYNMKFVPAHKKGLELVGDEEGLRIVLLKLYNRYMLKNNNFIIKYIESNVVISDDIGVELFLDKVQEKLDKIVSDEAYRVIKCYLKILIYRAKNSFFLKEIKNENFLKKTEEYKIVKSLIDELGEYYNLKINEIECLRILDFILGSHTYNYKTSYFENWIEIELLVKQIINNFSAIYGVDLNNDKILLEGLINHIKPTIHRLKNSLELENKIYEDVFKNYNDILDALSLSIAPLEEHLKMPISKEELSFLTLHFKVSLDKTMKREIKNILVVCTYGYGSSKLLAQELKENFNVNIVDIIPLNKLATSLDKYEIDFIISTVDISKNIHKNIIKVNPILSEEDFNVFLKNGIPKSKRKFMLSDVLNIIEKNCTIDNSEGLKNGLLNLFEHRIVDDIKVDALSLKNIRKEMIMIEESCSSWEEAIRVSGNILKNQGLINNDYILDMIDAIKRFGAYIVLGDQVAIPHAKGVAGETKTGYGIVKLKKPIEFPNKKLVDILIPFSSRDGIEHLELLKEINILLNKEKFCSGLRKLNSQEEIVKYIKNSMREL